MIVTKMWRRIGGGGNGVRNAEVSVGGTDFNGLTVLLLTVNRVYTTLHTLLAYRHDEARYQATEITTNTIASMGAAQVSYFNALIADAS
jgi:hypothetical protein